MNARRYVGDTMTPRHPSSARSLTSARPSVTQQTDRLGTAVRNNHKQTWECLPKQALSPASNNRAPHPTSFCWAEQRFALKGGGGGGRSSDISPRSHLLRSLQRGSFSYLQLETSR